jgi:hypothetical protein
MSNREKNAIDLSSAPRTSRIRRKSTHVTPVRQRERPYRPEREVWTVVIGVVLFALATSTIIVGISEVTSH